MMVLAARSPLEVVLTPVSHLESGGVRYSWNDLGRGLFIIERINKAVFVQ